MKFKQSLSTGWLFAVRYIVFFAYAVAMHYYDAPSWAIVMLVYICLQPSRFDMASDIAAVQSTVRQVRQDVNIEADKAETFREEVRKSRRQQ